MKTFQVKGTFRAGIAWEKFAKTIESQNEKNALDKAYSLFGSQHGLKRNMIKIESITEA
ncbi:50S ribosomal protein L18Ae [Methanolobus profundi]|uniref:Large ribosomal subunit protein eL20 n=1 Tax=Methanolobus profundi TaxID=487685 RepID=A0A1I4RS02_9EURY|nr:50S ribosomal protein L18Ae [Methanolobus profundi]SFM54988.1 LSU ribosomal protein LX [Methanolobus profundi]